jgi:hypothetical protein
LASQGITGRQVVSGESHRRATAYPPLTFPPLIGEGDNHGATTAATLSTAGYI